MKYNKILKDGFIFSINIGGGGIEITRDEYRKIQKALKSAPVDKEGFVSYLRDGDLIWVEMPIEE